ncbi:DUF4407 domain-containing protein [Mycobacterium sherrisii]|uniref:DUF4407 domain-containing protein n=1 Tax=Mycobacterium sherrisii TaxID=243061 RepID=UPI000A16A8AE|nr:DUF4407 domain-containing protein [Mycobacterium sherrisii]MCV7030220.1 DUF4407 domain-containing protein [Mycobacterium sherrisii]ORW76600.1 hypothetical protein AWC25_11630 [Mycobacterium sherrisii]
MGAHEVTEQRSAVSRVEGVLTWLGGGHWRDLSERHERSTHAVAGAVVVLGAGLAWAVAALAVSASTHWPPAAIVAGTLGVGLLVGAVTRGIASGPHRGRAGIAGRALVAVAVGVVVGELAALTVFSRSIDHHLDERALRTADTVPAVAQSSSALQQARNARGALDDAVAQARTRQDNALVVARCEYHPSPQCPQTRITGDPGTGPETRTANELLADAQRELDAALTARDRQAPELDATISRREQAVAEARQRVLADAHPDGLGARWIAMNDLTVAGTGALILRLATVAFFVLVYLLPLILRAWRGETTHDRHASARAERERAELDADTAIAIKRAEVRREAEILWAEHQLTQARLAIQAQTEIDREQQRRRVAEAIEGPTSSRNAVAPATGEVDEQMYLPIAAEAEAASRTMAALPCSAGQSDVLPPPQNLPAQIEPSDEAAPAVGRGAPLIPSLPDATRAAARWIRPLVPPIVARVIDNTATPLRTARQVFEEVEEITFALKRSRKVTFHAESSEGDEQPHSSAPTAGPATPAPGYPVDQVGGHEQRSAVRLSAGGGEDRSLDAATAERPRQLPHRDGPPELGAPQGPRQLPPGN